jgi:hypothetical protein
MSVSVHAVRNTANTMIVRSEWVIVANEIWDSFLVLTCASDQTAQADSRWNISDLCSCNIRFESQPNIDLMLRFLAVLLISSK